MPRPPRPAEPEFSLPPRKVKYDAKKEAAETLAATRTRMCNSVTSGKRCYHGKTCRFAHSLDELVIPACHFGERCRFIDFRNNRVSNVPGSKLCTFQHPHETKDQYFARIKQQGCVSSAREAKSTTDEFSAWKKAKLAGIPTQVSDKDRQFINDMKASIRPMQNLVVQAKMHVNKVNNMTA